MACADDTGSMRPIPPASELALRRSRIRTRTLLMLNSMGEAYLGQLARAVGTERKRIRAVMYGAMPAYRPDLSLIGLGLAEEVQTEHGRIFRITAAGKRKARSIVKRRERWPVSESP